ncbi:hypothetical protein HYFRA_00005713 [Hymenoscyphus fraxineus]|uniref:Uncharacterized protein n=1 Tax=Hymenoscyphus fraxineus TaxID=746836 RepID=A0A9N9KR11_9HELO|nr:hypothetical protein HYFRA_00005713 [Hymenoscyphus fraxineus]
MCIPNPVSPQPPALFAQAKNWRGEGRGTIGRLSRMMGGHGVGAGWSNGAAVFFSHDLPDLLEKVLFGGKRVMRRELRPDARYHKAKWEVGGASFKMTRPSRLEGQ